VYSTFVFGSGTRLLVKPSK
uniref:Uncharacterized protein n=1 Tax=Suricata suricatta TaxID=37032 RepID=A0A673TGQ6_SURSU